MPDLENHAAGGPPEQKEGGAVWRSCCLEADKRACIFFSQLSVSLLVLLFSALMLLGAEGDCERSSPYIGLISFVLGKLLSAIAM